jgi:hypothetical protein
LSAAERAFTFSNMPTPGLISRPDRIVVQCSSLSGSPPAAPSNQPVPRQDRIMAQCSFLNHTFTRACYWITQLHT